MIMARRPIRQVQLVGRKIRQLRKAHHLTQTELSSRIGMQQSDLSPTDVPDISVKLEPVEEGRRYNVVLELDPAAMAEGPFAGKLRLTTDSEKVPTVTVDLSGNLIRAGGETSG